VTGFDHETGTLNADNTWSIDARVAPTLA